jgi:hypothetical protein
MIVRRPPVGWVIIVRNDSVAAHGTPGKNPRERRYLERAKTRATLFAPA